MLWQRVLTAGLLIPLVLAALFYFPPMYFSVFVIVILLMASLEWSRIVNLRPAMLKWFFHILVILSAVYLVPNEFVILLIAAVYLLLPLWLHSRPVEQTAALLQHRSGPLVFFAIGLVYLVPAGASLLFLYQQDAYGSQYILFCMLLVWTADIGAYFTGRRLGKTKLAPHISPGKTREGVYGALLFSALVSVAGAHYLGHRGTGLLWMVFIAMLTVVYSVYGDLFESVFKRAAGVKDSGSILPGHGGVLDRIDSLLVALPIMTASLIVIRP